jgi:hypothetical protein
MLDASVTELDVLTPFLVVDFEMSSGPCDRQYSALSFAQTRKPPFSGSGAR